MALRNYGDLKTEVAAWLERGDSKTTSRIPDFIRMAEGDIYDKLRTQDNEFLVIHDSTSDFWDVWELPENFLEMKDVTVDNRPLRPIGGAELFRRTADNEAGPPDSYAIVERQLYIVPALPLAPGDWPDGTLVTYRYYGSESLDALANWRVPTNAVTAPGNESVRQTALPAHPDENTTRLFLRHPQLHLAGALHYAYAFLMNDKKRDYWGARFFQKLDQLAEAQAHSELTGGISLIGAPYGD